MVMTWKKAAKVSSIATVVSLVVSLGFDYGYGRTLDINEAILRSIVFCIAFGGVYWMLEKKSKL